jgi:hypothetical protein
MKIQITKPRVPEPCFTPYGVVDKHLVASAKLNSKDPFTLEYEIEVVTNDFGAKVETGFVIKKLSIILDSSAPMGLTTTHLREIPLNYLLEATVHQAIYPGSQKSQMAKFSSVTKISERQLKAAQIILNNPGESHARLLMQEFGISEGSARNLKTRVLKSGLIPRGRGSEPAAANLKQMSEEGDYIQQVLEGKIKNPVPPSEWRSLQKKRNTNRRAQNGKKKK